MEAIYCKKIEINGDLDNIRIVCIDSTKSEELAKYKLDIGSTSGAL